MSRYISFRDFDWLLFIFVLMICGLGVMEIHSATLHTKFAGAHVRQVYWVTGGVVGMFLVSLVNYQKLLDRVHWFYIAANDVNWTSLGKNENDSMPLGNGLPSAGLAPPSKGAEIGPCWPFTGSNERDRAATVGLGEAARQCHIAVQHWARIEPLRSFQVITRRNLLVGASVVALLVAVGGVEALLEAQPAAAQSATAAELLVPPPLGDRTLGKDDAPVTIVEYASMTCPHCAHFHATTLPLLKTKYIDPGKVRLILREFPFDPRAEAGFMLARCSGDNYFPMVDVLFKQQLQWAAVENSKDALLQIARLAGFPSLRFVYIEGANVNPDTIERLRDQLPDCEIEVK
jgi:protein-disulfide isomerase